MSTLNYSTYLQTWVDRFGLAYSGLDRFWVFGNGQAIPVEFENHRLTNEQFIQLLNELNQLNARLDRLLSFDHDSVDFDLLTAQVFQLELQLLI